MTRHITGRREFLKRLGMTGVGLAATTAGASLQSAEEEKGPANTIRVAAVQMHPELGDVDANLATARRLVRKAFEQKAKWVVLPEFFTSGMMMHPKMFETPRPLDGTPMQMLKDLAKEGDAVVAGSFLAKSGENVYNTGVVAAPCGKTYTHDKDFPSTVYESTFYAGGEDGEYLAALVEHGTISAEHSHEPIASRPGNNKDGVFEIAGLRVGMALCWEIVRNRTLSRMRNQVDLVLAGSCWFSAHADYGFPSYSREQLNVLWDGQKRLIREAPRRFARSVGAPVIHTNTFGVNPGLYRGDPKQEVRCRYLGESQIVDGRGVPIASQSDGEGVLVADVRVGDWEPSCEIGDEFWIPEVPKDFAKSLWADTGFAGREEYLTSTRRRYNQGGK